MIKLPLLKLINNNLYFIFQDKYFNNSDNSIIKYIKKECNELKNLNIKNIDKNKIINYLIDIFVSNDSLDLNSKRYKNYVSHLTTYIQEIVIDNKPLLFNLYILPKEININIINENNNNNDEENIKNIIEKIENFSYQLYSEYTKNIDNNKNIKFKLTNKKKFEAKNFLQLELMFYHQELKILDNLISNYNWNYKDKIIVSNKIIGIPIRELNDKNGNNPLKIWQTIKDKEDSKLAIFLYSTLKFLEEHKINIFDNEDNKELFNKVKKQIKNLENTILDLVPYNIEKDIIIPKKYLNNHKNDVNDINEIKLKYLNKYFNEYKNEEEIQNNLEIYEHIRTLFNNSFNNGIFVFESIDLSRFLENSLDKYLIETCKNENEIVFKGDENKKNIISLDGKHKYYNNKSKNSCSFVTNNNERENFFEEFPDNLIGLLENNNMSSANYIITDIFDAKYYLLEDLKKNQDLHLKIYHQKHFFEFNNGGNHKINSCNFVIPKNIDFNIDISTKEDKLKIKYNDYKDNNISLIEERTLKFVYDENFVINIKSLELFSFV